MSYTPTTWNTGDTITSSALNKIEQGIANSGGGGALICTSSFSASLQKSVLDKTVQEIYDAMESGTPVYIKYQYGTPSGAYVSFLILAPVVKIYAYNYTEIIRIMALRPSPSTFSKTGYSYLNSSSVLLYSATGLNEYPSFYTSVDVGNTYTDVSGSI